MFGHLQPPRTAQHAPVVTRGGRTGRRGSARGGDERTKWDGVLISAGAGIGAGLQLRPAPPPEEIEAPAEPADHAGASTPEALEYVRMTNQFVIPLVEEGRNHLLLRAPIGITCPVRLLHGQGDPDVPWDLSLRLAERLRSGDVQLTVIKDGDHRLSRDADITLLLQTLGSLG